MNRGLNWICLTPTRNESWIIPNFIRAARLWASTIIVADQNSTDGTREYLQRAPKVQVVPNDSPVYDESYRQTLLIERARQIKGRRILIALDADEALSANCFTSEEWSRINDAVPGTVLRFRWVNILPGFDQAWIPNEMIACGFVDDGSVHTGARIHSRRIPWPKGAPVLDLDEVVVLHFQYVAWDRVMSKQRWYQAWERINHPHKGALDIFRQYHHMQGSWNNDEIHPVRPEWLEGYYKAGVDFRTLQSERVTWWDRELVRMLGEHGPDKFAKIDLWDKNWNEVARGLSATSINLTDPRSLTQRLIHRVLRVTQNRRTNWGVRCFERLLRESGW